MNRRQLPWLLILSAAILLAATRPPAKRPTISHHTVGNVTYTDTNGDGKIDRETTAREDGSFVVKQDRDFDGIFDVRFERRPDGTTHNHTDIHEKPAEIEEVRADSRAPEEWFIFGLPAHRVIAAAAVVVVIAVAIIVLRVLMKRRARAKGSGKQSEG